MGTVSEDLIQSQFNRFRVFFQDYRIISARFLFAIIASDNNQNSRNKKKRISD